MIRPMTTEEIRWALWHAADLCIDLQESEWWLLEIIRADAVFEKAFEMSGNYTGAGHTDDPMQAAMFLLFVAEAL